GSFLFVPVFKDVARLTVQGLADGVQRGKAHRARLAGLENGEVGHGDAHLLGKLRQAHFALGEHDVQIDDDSHAAPPYMVRSFSLLMAAARRTSWASALASSATSAQAAAKPSMAMSSAGSPMPSRHSAATPAASSAAIVNA